MFYCFVMGLIAFPFFTRFHQLCVFIFWFCPGALHKNCSCIWQEKFGRPPPPSLPSQPWTLNSELLRLKDFRRAMYTCTYLSFYWQENSFSFLMCLNKLLQLLNNCNPFIAIFFFLTALIRSIATFEGVLREYQIALHNGKWFVCTEIRRRAAESFPHFKRRSQILQGTRASEDSEFT